MRKILFTDLDGTLLNDKKLVSEGNREAIHRLLKAGHFLAIATGRPVKSALQVAKELGLTMQGCYIVAYNGAIIFDSARESICTEYTLALEDVRYLFAEAEKYGIHIQTYGENDDILTTKESPELEQYRKGNRNALQYQICADVCEALRKNPNKVLMISAEEKLLQFQKEHREWESGRCDSIFSSKEYLEYVPKNINKGTGVVALCELLDIPLEHAYAVGDERNDNSMIRAAGVGVAVQNAFEGTKEAADYVTKNDHNHDAIAEVIDELIFNKKFTNISV